MAHSDQSLYQRTLAFAGVCQAASLVHEVAKKGNCDQDAFKVSLRSITNLNPESTLAVYGDLKSLEYGLRSLVNGIDNEVTRYMVSILTLERKLSSNADAMNTLAQRLETVEHQLNHYDLIDDTMIGNIASVYLDVVSPIGPRIKVSGSPAILQQTTNQHKVRALLLAGIRSAVLWHQVGGRRRHLIFSRQSLLKEATRLLDQ